MTNQEELISKKDLLLETGISYGQLYRWKRQNLIPDAWFMKQSSFTGQETFFPKQKILARIRAILEMKDSHSLEDLATYFSPVSVDRRTYVLMDAGEAIGLPSTAAELCIRLWGKHRFTFTELLFIDLLVALEADIGLSEQERREWIVTSKRWAAQVAGADRQVLVFRKRRMLSFMMLDAPARFVLDEESEWMATYDLSERSKDLRMKLQNVAEV